jgi:hypothetical protein
MDIPNMLLQRLRLRRLPKPLARGILVAETSLLDLLKTAWNVASIAIGRGTPPGDVAPLLRAHHDAVRSGAPVPVGVEEGTRAVEIIRRLWPVQEPAGASSAQA